MANDSSNGGQTSFLGTGWSFPPEFPIRTESGAEGDRPIGSVLMHVDEADVQASLRILFGTTVGERFLHPSFGLDVQALQFEPLSTTLRTFTKDRIKRAILIHEPRISIVSLDVVNPDPNEGTLAIVLEYEIRATNSRYNLVYPFYESDSNELRTTVNR